MEGSRGCMDQALWDMCAAVVMYLLQVPKHTTMSAERPLPAQCALVTTSESPHLLQGQPGPLLEAVAAARARGLVLAMGRKAGGPAHARCNETSITDSLAACRACSGSVQQVHGRRWSKKQQLGPRQAEQGQVAPVCVLEELRGWSTAAGVLLEAGGGRHHGGPGACSAAAN